jgi:hypothetical protein
MIKNAHITVITSPELTAMRLDDLIGCRGLVVRFYQKTVSQIEALWYCSKSLILASIYGLSLKIQ